MWTIKRLSANTFGLVVPWEQVTRDTMARAYEIAAWVVRHRYLDVTPEVQVEGVWIHTTTKTTPEVACRALAAAAAYLGLDFTRDANTPASSPATSV